MPSIVEAGPSSPKQAKKQQSISSFFSRISQPPKSQDRSSSQTKENDIVLSKHESGSNDSAHPKSQLTEHCKRPKDDEDDYSLPETKRPRRNTDQDNENASTLVDSNNDNRVSKHLNSEPDSQPPTKVRAWNYQSSSSRVSQEPSTENDEQLHRKAELHEKFVKKLGRPERTIKAQLQSSAVSADSTEEQSGIEEDNDKEEEARPAGRRGAKTKKGHGNLTPLEKQVLEIKKEHTDTILVVEVGYKFRFFGEDARIASKELSIVCIPGKYRYDEHPSEAHLDRFASASIPVHRLHVHVKRLVTAGYKVGIVRQLETAALKAAGDNRHAPFVRKLTNLYTKGTYIDDVEGLRNSGNELIGTSSGPGYLLCITEGKAKSSDTDEKVNVGIIAVQPATGHIIYDEFEDGFMRNETESRLIHIAPCEVLIVGNLSKPSDKLLKRLSGSKISLFGDHVRTEVVDKPKTAMTEAYNHVSTFYAEKMSSSSTQNDEVACKVLDEVLQLPENVIVCLSAMLKHLSEYGLEHVFDLTKYFQCFTTRTHMFLNATTLTSLEIYLNQTDYTETGSLFWALNRTKTSFGRRLLRNWVGRPLLDKRQLEERANAVEELKEKENHHIVRRLDGLLSRIKADLERCLIRIYYGRSTRPEFATVLQTLQGIASEFMSLEKPEDVGFNSSVINESIASLKVIRDDVVKFLDRINIEAAKANDKYTFFRESEETDDINEHKLGIAVVESELDQHRKTLSDVLKKKKVEYVTVAGIEYLVEVPNDKLSLSRVPALWTKISGTKKVSRFHSPEVVTLLRERDQHKEALAAACDKAFSRLLAEFAEKYQKFRDVIQSLAHLDCLLSLSNIAKQPGYVKPAYTDTTSMNVKSGRHPMVEQLLLDSYVPNDITLSTDSTRALLITGPNMGGKSSYVRQVALIAIMGQIGSYVPATSATLGMFDAVFTRMGAFDNMMAGESTFMVELSETSDILKQATSQSLVILDELGRGTSTHDGVSIAQAVLDHLITQTKALTLFITHYQNLSVLASSFPDDILKNMHMKFKEGGTAGREITFLYEVAEGVAHRSYGLNVARLANVPGKVLDIAEIKSRALEKEVSKKKTRGLERTMREVLAGQSDNVLEDLLRRVDML